MALRSNFLTGTMQPVFATAGSFSMYLILSQRKQGHYRIGAKLVSTHTSKRYAETLHITSAGPEPICQPSSNKFRIIKHLKSVSNIPNRLFQWLSLIFTPLLPAFIH